MRIFIFLSTVIVLISCQRIETGKSLDKKTTGLIRSLGLLDNDEQIVKFYSNLTKTTAGNFFTNKRLAMYWLDKDTSKAEVSFAFYPTIVSIDTVYSVPDTFIPYMLITRTDSSQFKVYVDGKRNEIKNFFEEAINLWQLHKGAIPAH